MRLIDVDNLYELIRCNYPSLLKEIEQYYFSNDKLKNGTNELLNSDLEVSTMAMINIKPNNSITIENISIDSRYLEEEGYVKVVRCRDCNYKHTGFCPMLESAAYNENGYCSEGVPENE